MPARRRKRNINPDIRAPLSRKKVVLLALLAIFIVVIVSLALALSRSTTNYFVLADAKNDGNLEVSYIDLKDNQKFVVTVPSDTEVNLGRRRGVLRASSVKKIIDSEKTDGQIIADTLIKTFHFPVDYWRLGVYTDMPLPLQIRLRIANLKGMNSQEIDLSETSYISPSKLPDGEEGYIVRDVMPLLLQTTFADPEIASSRLAIELVNKTGEDPYYLSDVVRVLEVLGAKVAPIISEEKSESGCTITSLHKDSLERIAKVLNCDQILSEPSSFDMEIVLGKGFFERF